MTYLNKNIHFFLILIFPLAFLVGNAAINFITILIILSSFFLKTEILEFYKNNKIIIFLIFINVVYFSINIFTNSFLNNPEHKIYFQFHNDVELYMNNLYFLNFKSFISIIKLFLLFIAIQIILKKINFLKLLRIWKFLFIILCIDTIFQYIFGFNLIGQNAEFYPNQCEKYSFFYLFDKNIDNNIFCIPFENVWRLSSFFGDERVIGAFLVYFFPVFLSVMNFTKKNDLVFTSIIGLSIFISGERMSFILFISILIIFFLVKVINQGKFYFLRILFLIVIFLFVGLFFFSSNNILKNRYIEVNQIYKELYNKDRINVPYLSLWDRAMDTFLKNKYYGYGVNYFRDCKYSRYDYEKQKNIIVVYPDIIKKYGQNSCSTHPHNFFIQLSSEFGIFGLLIFLSIFFYTFKHIVFKFKNFSKEMYFISSFILILILFSPFKVSGNIFSTFYGTMFFFLFSISFFNIKTKVR